MIIFRLQEKYDLVNWFRPDNILKFLERPWESHVRVSEKNTNDGYIFDFVLHDRI